MKIFIALALSLTCFTVHAEVQTQIVEYSSGDQTFEGFVAWNSDSKPGASPGVLVVHQWMGLTDYEKSRCKQLAELGYTAFAVDVYGKGVRPSNPGEAGSMAGKFKGDRPELRRRLALGLEQLKATPSVDSKRLAAIGYCFGGTGAIELARHGAELRGVVSFHGGLDSPTPKDGANIRARILVCHGADDPFVPRKDIDAFKSELNAARVDWQLIEYSQTVHSFTHSDAGNDNSRGAAYNRLSDERSWQSMQDFFDEIFDGSDAQ